MAMGKRLMARPSITWLIPDTHFYHDNMVISCGRPENHTDITIRNLKQHMAPQDILIHLGDVIFHRYHELKSILHSIPGTKILTRGNHDKKPIGWYMRNGFNFAADMIQIGNIAFSHKPISPLPSGVRLNIHGHWHNNRNVVRPPFYNDQQYRLLALEDIGYKPVQLNSFKD